MVQRYGPPAAAALPDRGKQTTAAAFFSQSGSMRRRRIHYIEMRAADKKGFGFVPQKSGR
jgi:hypothetical protein